jgi:TorA maturation chaperone TorD
MENAVKIQTETMPDTDEFISEKVSMVKLAYLFADMFGVPSEINHGHAQQLLEYGEGMSRLSEDCFPMNADTFTETWRRDVRALFDGESPLRLEESVYKSWTSQKNHPLRGVRGHCFGDHAAHMEAVLSSYGMTVETGYRLAPDSLSTIFEFLAFLLENRPPSEVVSFCEDHLDWMEDLREKAVENNAGMALLCVISKAKIFIHDLVQKMELFDERTVKK